MKKVACALETQWSKKAFFFSGHLFTCPVKTTGKPNVCTDKEKRIKESSAWARKATFTKRKQVDYLTGKSAPVRRLLVAFSISREISKEVFENKTQHNNIVAETSVKLDYTKCSSHK